MGSVRLGKRGVRLCKEGIVAGGGIREGMGS